MRKILNFMSTVRVVLLLAFLLLPAQSNSLLTGKVFASNTQSQTSTVSINPQSSTVPGWANFTISVDVTNVTNLYVWQIALEYNANVMNITDVWIPDNNIFANYATVTPYQPVFGTDSDDGLGYMLYGCSLLGSTPTSVSASTGILLSINFTALTTGTSPIDIATAANPVVTGVVPPAPVAFYTFLDDINLNDMPFVAQNGIANVGTSYLTLTSTTGGTTNPPPGTYLFENNSQLIITESPNLGYDFNHWQIDGANAGSSNTTTITMGENHTVQAVFAPHIPVTWTVDWQGGANFTSIQEAINSPLVAYGDIILVKPGVYYENVNMTKELTLIGTDEDNTIIDGNGTGTVVSVYGNLTGFTITNGDYGVSVTLVQAYNTTQGASATVYYEDSAWINGNRIVNNLIGGVTVGTLGQTSVPHDTNTTVSNNYVANNTVYGIHIWNAWNNLIINNTVENNEYGIDFYGNSYNNTLRNNNMLNNQYNFGIILQGATWDYQDDGYLFLNNDVDTSNTVNGKPVIYWTNKNDAQVPSNAGYVLLCNCTDISVNDCNLANNIQGVLTVNSNNTQIGQNTITNNAYGICIIQCENNTLTANSLVDNIYGVFLGYLSKHTTMRNNSISGGQFNFGMDTFELGTLSDLMTVSTSGVNNTCLANDIDGSNTLDGKPMVYWINQHDMQVPANAGFVMLINCTNIKVQGLNLTNNLENIVIIASNNTVVCNNYVANSVYGVRASDFSYYLNKTSTIDIQCFNITISGNTLSNNGVALDLLNVENSTIQGNTLEENPVGIFSDTDYSTISANTISNCTTPNPPYPGSNLDTNDLYVFYYPAPAFDFSFEWAIELEEIAGIIVGGNGNTVYGNTVTNSLFSIILGDFTRNIWSGDNIIFHNNFINYTGQEQAFDLGGGNRWDDGYPGGGNYWSDSNKTDLYSGPGQNITGSDGICDNPYPIPRASNLPGRVYDYDNYPLTMPVTVYEAAVCNGTYYEVDVQSNSTTSDFAFNGASQPSISFTINGQSGTNGFCKVTIPNQVLWAWNGQWTVLVNGAQVPYSVSEDANYTYITFNNSPNTENVQIIGTNAIPEYPPITILTVLMILALAVALLTTKTKRKKQL